MLKNLFQAWRFKIVDRCFKGKDNGHILVGGIRIIDNKKLRKPFTNGLKC